MVRVAAQGRGSRAGRADDAPCPQVQNISLLEGEAVTVETVGGAEPVVLANESFLLRGQVIRSPSNQVAVRYQSPAPARAGAFRFRFQGKGRSPIPGSPRQAQPPAWAPLPRLVA